MAQLIFKQLLAGRDFARKDFAAEQMRNFVYLIGDRDSGKALLVDPAWAVDELVDLVRAEGLELSGALVTHYHPDHIGGEMFGIEVQGLARLMEISPCPVHIHKLERAGVCAMTGLSLNDLVAHDGGDRVQVGDIEVELLHTPGHTPGSLCFRLDQSLVSGDTLFLQGCGRVDLPGGDAEQLFHSLAKLKELADGTIVFPGHDYGGSEAPLRRLKNENHYLRVSDLLSWKRMFGLN